MNPWFIQPLSPTSLLPNKRMRGIRSPPPLMLMPTAHLPKNAYGSSGDISAAAEQNPLNGGTLPCPHGTKESCSWPLSQSLSSLARSCAFMLALLRIGSIHEKNCLSGLSNLLCGSWFKSISSAHVILKLTEYERNTATF